MKFIKFTDPSGGDVWLVARWVTKVSAPTRGQFPLSARAVISMGANNQAVTQSVEEIIRLLESIDATDGEG